MGRFFLVLGLFTLLIGCQTTETVVVEEHPSYKKEEKTEHKGTESTFSSKGGFKDVVRDPIDYSSCSKKDAILFDGHYFCSQESVEQYKNR